MASTLRYGSRGSDVSRLQELLNKNGYALETDGIFGKKTQSAVRDYQKKNALAIDGIVGNKTWDSLSGTSSAVYSGTPDVPSYETGRPEERVSEETSAAKDKVTQLESTAPAPYASAYADRIAALLDELEAREAFTYDPNADPTYRAALDAYRREGRRAAEDAMGNAAALTGGYGSSYAASASAAAQQNAMGQAVGLIGELAGNAYERYRGETNDLYSRMSLLQGLDEGAYGRYRDTVSDYRDDLAYYYGKYADMSAQDYARYRDDLSAWQRDRDYYYARHWNEEQLAYQKARDALSRASSGGGGSGSSAKQSKQFTNVYNKAKTLEGATLTKYLAAQVEAGNITSSESSSMRAMIDGGLRDTDSDYESRLVTLYTVPSGSGTDTPYQITKAQQERYDKLMRAMYPNGPTLRK